MVQKKMIKVINEFGEEVEVEVEEEILVTDSDQESSYLSVNSKGLPTRGRGLKNRRKAK